MFQFVPWKLYKALSIRYSTQEFLQCLILRMIWMKVLETFGTKGQWRDTVFFFFEGSSKIVEKVTPAAQGGAVGSVRLLRLKLPRLPGPKYHVWTVHETPADKGHGCGFSQ